MDAGMQSRAYQTDADALQSVFEPLIDNTSTTDDSVSIMHQSESLHRRRRDENQLFRVQYIDDDVGKIRHNQLDVRQDDQARRRRQLDPLRVLPQPQGPAQLLEWMYIITVEIAMAATSTRNESHGSKSTAAERVHIKMPL